MFGELEEPVYVELILNVLGADFFKNNKPLESHTSKDLFCEIKLEK